jgi:DUF2958 family protein
MDVSFGGDLMKSLTKAIEAKLEKFPLYSHDGCKRPDVIVKFFTPDSNWTWYVTEGNKTETGDWEFFGLVEGFESELGYFTLSDLQSAKGPLGLSIERDKYFDGYVLDMEQNPIKAVRNA